MRKGDLWLLLLLLLTAAVLALALRPRGEGGMVRVSLDGEEAGLYPLSEDRTVRIGGEDYNILVIQDGGARVTEANCGDHTCLRAGTIREAGERIVCLPHRLVVEVVDGGTPGVDASAG